MDERRAVEALVAALIDRLVREAGLADPGARAELRRELESHFADAGDSPEALRAALARFGDADAVVAGLRRAHGRGVRLLRVARLAASLVASIVVTFALQALVGVVSAPAAFARPGPWHLLGALFATALALAAVGAWELGASFVRTRLERHPLRLAAAVGAAAAAVYLVHLATDTAVAPEFAVAAGGTTVAAWMASIAIVARLDLAFLRRFGPTD